MSKIEPSGCSRKEHLRRGIVWGIVVLLAILLLSGAASADYWWNASYYKIPLRVNNTGNASVLTDFQVKANITYNSTSMDTNFTSFHLVNETSETEMVGRFWIERNISVNGSYANVWLNLSSIPASSWDNTTYALYSRKVVESDASNGTNTFEFFDDFDSGNTQLTVIGTNIFFVNQRMEFTNLGSAAGSGYAYKQIDSMSSFAYEYDLLITSGAGPSFDPFVGLMDGIGYEATTGINSIGGAIVGTDGFARIDRFWPEVLSSQISASFDTVYYLRLLYFDDTTTLYVFTDSAQTTQIGGSPLTLSATVPSMSYVFPINYNKASVDRLFSGWTDNYRLRKYVSPEPTVEFGAWEESGIIIISCPIGWCYLAQNYTSKTLLELDNFFSTDTIQGKYNAASQKYESHRTGYSFNQNVTVAQKEGYYYYFSSAQDVTMTPGSTPSITLKTGWNLVANYQTSARTLSALKSSIGASATQAKYYDRTSKTWGSTDSQEVPAMESFFVYLTSQQDWSG